MDSWRPVPPWGLSFECGKTRRCFELQDLEKPAGLCQMQWVNDQSGLENPFWPSNGRIVSSADPVVFDPNTSSPWLSLDADLTTVRESSEPLITPDNPERFERCSFVLGSEGYTSGQHRWDVMVGDSPSWVVGVCKEAVARKNPFTLSPNRGVWCIGLSKGVCTVFANERKALQVQQRLERIRIKLNMNEGEVSFWDGENATHLATLQHNFNMKIFPFFGPGVHNTSMILAPGKINMHIS